jgi:hypothetical protein
MRELILVLLVMPLFIFGCDLESKDTQNNEKLVQDSIRIDSLRQIRCDSLLNYITQTNSGKVNLPDSIPTNIDECIAQLDTCTNDTIKSWIKCVTEREYVSTLHHGFGMYLRNNWGLWANSQLSQFFNENGIFHPDDMSGIILQCFHEFVNTGKYSMTEKVEYYKEYWNKLKEKEDSLKQVNSQKYIETKRFVDSLHNAIDYEANFSNIQGLVRDSLNFYIEQIRGDTIYIWTSGSSSRLSKEGYLNITKYKRFGKSLFFGYISEDGAIYDMSLKEQRFIRKEGSLYYEEESGGFVKIITPEMIRNPEKVNEWEPVSDCSFNKSFVKTLWKLEGRKYYNLEMQGDCRGTGLKVGYFIDEDLNVIFDEHIRKELWKSKKLIDK